METSNNDDEKNDEYNLELLSGESDNDIVRIYNEMSTHSSSPTSYHTFRRDVFTFYIEQEDELPAKCVICQQKTDWPKIILHCKCEYHLACFQTLVNPIKCLFCDDKILKTCASDYQKCSICLELLKDDVKKISCNHRFHNKCLLRWQCSFQNNHDKCPNCRSDI